MTCTAVSVKRPGGNAAHAAAVIALILFGLSIRYAYISRNFVIARDSVDYLKTAGGIEREGPGAVRKSVRQPLYPAVLWLAGRIRQSVGGPMQWRGEEMAQVGRWTGFALYVPFLLAAFAFFKRLVGRRLALVCMFILIVDPLFGRNFANVLSETLYLTFFLLALLCLTHAFDRSAPARRQWLWACGAGCAAALAYMTRVEGQILFAAGITCAGISGAAALRRKTGRLRDSLVTAGCLAAGYLVLALPLMLYLGASSQRYSWEWLWGRLTAAAPPGCGAPQLRPAIALAGVGAHPLNALAMTAAELARSSPVTMIVLVTSSLRRAFARMKGRRPLPLPRSARPVIVTAAWYVLAIVAGVSIQNGTVSQRYLQGLDVMMLPVAVMLVAGAPALRGWLDRHRKSAVTAGTVLGCLLVAVALWNALLCSAHYKTGCRDAGAAIGNLSRGTPVVLTSNRRIAYYAGADDRKAWPKDLEAAVLAGLPMDRAFIVLETKLFDRNRLSNMKTSLEEQGFRSGAQLEFAEDSRGAGSGGKILIFVRAAPS